MLIDVPLAESPDAETPDAETASAETWRCHSHYNAIQYNVEKFIQPPLREKDSGRRFTYIKSNVK